MLEVFVADSLGQVRLRIASLWTPVYLPSTLATSGCYDVVAVAAKSFRGTVEFHLVRHLHISKHEN